jgi:hypothetical protein
VDGPAFRIGRSNPQVIVSPSCRERPDATDYWDGNWICTTITLAAGAFRAEVEAQLRAEDFVRFRDRLRPLHAKLVGRAKFDTMEEWLSIDVEGDGKGHFRADCVAVDTPGTGNRLTFAIELDQTDLPEILKGLDAIALAFPVVGALEGRR